MEPPPVDRAPDRSRTVLYAVGVLAIAIGTLLAAPPVGTWFLARMFAASVHPTQLPSMVAGYLAVGLGIWAIAVARPMGRSPDRSRSPARRAAPWIAATLLYVAAPVALASWLGVWGDARPLAYLDQYPEAQLAYPGATLAATERHTAHNWFDGATPASISTTFETDDDVGDVLAWYDDALQARGWTRRIQPGYVTREANWTKDYLRFDVGFPPASVGDRTRVEAEMQALDLLEDLSSLRRLEADPVLELLVPGSTPRTTVGDQGRKTGKNEVWPAALTRAHDTPWTPDEVVGFYERELPPRGWAPAAPAWPGAPTWSKDGTTFVLSFGTHDGAGRTYQVRLEEILPPDAPTMPPPWDRSPSGITLGF